LRDEANNFYSTSGPSNVKGDKYSARTFGSDNWVSIEKAIVSNCSAVREWDSNGTVFGYNGDLPGHQAGEFGHNDFYPVIISAA